ncbi:hypothetical protein GQ457_01G025350 [Hibiscus cannabinus]
MLTVLLGGSSNMASIGGVIRGTNGGWVFGFSRSIDSCLVLVDVLWAAIDTLFHAWGLGFRQVVLELDNNNVVKILQGTSMVLRDSAISLWVTELLQRDWDVRISHVYREANTVIDGLAGLAWGKPLGVWFYDSPSLEVVALVSVDVSLS